MRRLGSGFSEVMGEASRNAIIVAALCSVATVASAQERAPAAQNASAAVDAGGDIVVTATRRSESIRNIPSSISALTEESLAQSGATQASDVVSQVPGFAYTQNSVGQAVLAMRGIQTGATVGNVQAPVAIYYNEVPVLDPFIPWTVPSLKLFDSSRVEVLRGPQGTLFGAGALSGAMRIISNAPDSTTFSAATEDTVNVNDRGGVGYTLNGMVNVPLIQDKLAVRAVGFYDYTAGWIDNPVLGQKRGNHAKVYGGRIAVEWKPTEDLKVTLTGSQEVTRPNDSNYVAYGSRSDVATNQVRIYNDDNTKIANLTIDYTMPWATLTSSTSYIHRKAFASMDFTGVTRDLVTGLNVPSPLLDDFTTKNFLQEIRLSSSQDHPFKWVIGGFMERYRFNLHETITQAGFTLPGFVPETLENTVLRTRINDEAVFGELSYDIVPDLTVTVGGRYAHFSVSSERDNGITGPTVFEPVPGTFGRGAKYNAFTPKINLSYKPNADVLLYALVNKGFRTGNSNLNPLIDPISGLPLPPTYKPDQLWNYEIGTKLALLDNKLRIDLAAYYIDWKNIQLQISAPVSGFNYIDNAGTATSKGIEAQITVKLTTVLELGTSLNYTDAKMKSVNPLVAAKVGDRLPGSAPFTAYVYGQYDVPLETGTNLSFRADYSYTGREYSYLNNKNDPTAIRYGNYASVGLRSTLSFDNYEVALFVRNLANTRGRIAARRLYSPTVEVLQPPRTIGVTFRAKW